MSTDESASIANLASNLPATGAASWAPATQPPAPAPAMISAPLQFQFDGGAGSYFLVGLLSGLLTVVTLGIAAPWSMTMLYRWKAEHTLINGQRVTFTGTGGSLFGNYIKWWFLCIITLGIYSFWVYPRLTGWIVEHQQIQIPVEAAH